MPISICASAEALPPNFFLTDCAVSGGTLETFLRRAMDAAQGQLCVCLSPVHMDFCLPCARGTGRPLTAAEASVLCGDAPRHFSQALCTDYVTLLLDGQLHTVLLDCTETLRRKLLLADRLGVPYALIEDPALRQALAHFC